MEFQVESVQKTTSSEYFEVKCGADGQLTSPVVAVDGQLSMFSSLCVGVQVYESKLQELQKQVETISLVAETPDEEELEEEEEEEGVYCKSSVLQIFLYFYFVSPKICTCCVFSSTYVSRAQSAGLCVQYFLFYNQSNVIST